MCLVKKGCKSKVFESESGLHFWITSHIVSSAGFGYFAVMSCIEVWVCHNVIKTEVRHTWPFANRVGRSSVAFDEVSLARPNSTSTSNGLKRTLVSVLHSSSVQHSSCPLIVIPDPTQIIHLTPGCREPATECYCCGFLLLDSTCKHRSHCEHIEPLAADPSRHDVIAPQHALIGCWWWMMMARFILTQLVLMQPSLLLVPSLLYLQASPPSVSILFVL